MFSLRDPYILFLEVIFKFKAQRYKSQKISGPFINLIYIVIYQTPYPTSILYTENACAFHVTRKVHIFNCTSNNFTMEAYFMGPD